MIAVNYNPTARTLCIEGHAGSAPKGEDLVCASVSALAYALEAHCARHEKYHAEFKKVERIGLWYCTMKSGKGAKPMECIADGLRLIAENYPEYIKFNERTDISGNN